MSGRAPRACGSPAAYRRHLRRGEKACDACLAAHRATWRPEYAANRKARRRAARSVRAGDAAADGAQVLAGSANDSGDLGLVLPGVHRLDDQGVHPGVGAALGGDGADESGHDGCLLIGQPEHASSSSIPGGDLRLRDLTRTVVTAKIVGTHPTTSRPPLTAIAGRRHTPIQQEEGAA